MPSIAEMVDAAEKDIEDVKPRMVIVSSRIANCRMFKKAVLYPEWILE